MVDEALKVTRSEDGQFKVEVGGEGGAAVDITDLLTSLTVAIFPTGIEVDGGGNGQVTLLLNAPLVIEDVRVDRREWPFANMTNEQLKTMRAQLDYETHSRLQG